jgi:ketosteroid isomerase-like protein
VGGRYTGHDGLKKFFATLMQHVNSNVTVERMIDAGDHVVAIGRTKGTVLANQKTFDVPVAHVWHVKDGKLAAFYPYIDNKLMLEALSD